MANSTSYRIFNPIELKPLYISLGIPKTTFAAKTAGTPAPFSASLPGRPSNYPDSVWLFRGENCLLFNITSGKFELGPVRIADAWGKGSWPALFASGIDAAVWGGPAFPNLVYFFKESEYARINVSPLAGRVDVPPRPITADFASARGTWFANGCDAALHDPGIKYQGMLHLFHGAEYIRHDLNTGSRVAGPMPITQAFQLPAPFAQKIDLAFYGVGQETEKIYFMSGDQFALYDPRQNVVEQQGAIEDRFPVMAEYIPRPQLFLVEDYSLNMYAGPLQDFAPVGTYTLNPSTKTTIRVVVETVETTAASQQQSLLSSQSDADVTNFCNQLQSNSQQGGGKDQYGYQLDASFHGDASATSLTGGEVNANLAAKGGTEDVRSNFASAAANTFTQQVNRSAVQIQATTQDSQETFQKTDHYISDSTSVVDNSQSSEPKNFVFQRQAQPYLTVLVLTGERIAYVDQDGVQIETLPSLDKILQQRIASDADRKTIHDLITGELTSIADANGVPRSIIKQLAPPPGSANGPSYVVDTNLTTSYHLQLQDGTTQDVVVNGIIKSAHTGVMPTNMVLLEDRA